MKKLFYKLWNTVLFYFIVIRNILLVFKKVEYQKLLFGLLDVIGVILLSLLIILSPLIALVVTIIKFRLIKDTKAEK